MDMMMKRKSGRKKFKETRHPIYRGVRRRNGNKWVCEVREPNSKNNARIWLGTYPTPELAARAHDVAALALKGTSASFNFPDSPFLLPLPTSSSPTHIREALSKALQPFFKPTTTTTSTTLSSSSSSSSIMCGNENDNNMVVEEEVMDAKKEENNADEIEDEETRRRRRMFFDEEALYNMPAFLDSMAEALLITPPSMIRAMDDEHHIASSQIIDFNNLWTY
ncbi:hypothetical protein PIB30_005689 [Stylosanthes scabra]|uniref:AP2/ERF domain-containing protein n=1 Tax=Stylosanthes scabra TaxID=79078 RepID=A0ABU6U4A2_9FABA|nr:hypothetical protein [Stylosanthes scabra]